MALNPGAVENQWEDVVISKRKPADTKSTKVSNFNQTLGKTKTTSGPTSVS